MLNWSRYLESLCNAYAQWWKFGTLKDVVEPESVESEPSTLPFEFGLMVQTVEPDAQQRSKEEQKVERLSVLEGLRKYASEHVLLVGRPGSGKSTALVRLLLEEAQQARQNPHSLIPVLVELRTYKVYYKTSVLDLVQASLKRRKLRLNIETIEDELAEGRFLLLMDGINELPDDEARRNIKEFRLDYSDVPMVFTTRDLSVGGDLAIEKKLEMQSLTETEVEKFVRECMPGGSEERLQQLRQRLRELGQTPFVMWMLYFIVQKTGRVPSGAGSAFREFTQLYERRSKDDAPVSEESCRWWSRLLEHLGFEMMQAEKPIDFRLTISKREAEDILTKVLDREKFDKPRDYALRWLDDLLKHHLIQVTSNDQIEFCHQLIQEYYAAGRLLKLLTSPPTPLLGGEGSKIVPPFPRREGGLGGLGLSDETLKREYLNYLKWTEPLALMLELVEDEAQAVRLVKLALEVDLRLGARLAGAVKPEWHEQTVGLVAGLDVPPLLKIQLLEITKSERTIPELVKALNHEDSDVRKSAAEALGKIGSDATIPGLVKALNDENSFIAKIAAEALGRIGSDSAIPELVKALNHEDSDVRKSAAEALGKIDSDSAIPGLVKALNHKDSLVRRVAANALGKIGSDSAIPELVKALNDENSFVRWVAANALGKIGSVVAISKLVKALSHEDSSVRESVAEVLGKIGSVATIPGLIKALNDENSSAPTIAAEALGRIGSDTAIPGLVKALNHKNSSVRKNAAEALGKIGSDTAIPGLVQAFNHEDPSVRWRVADALGKIGSDAVIPELFKALNHKDSVVRRIATHALGRIGSDSAISELVKALDHEDSSVRWRVIDALANIASYELLPNLLERLKIAEETNLLNTISAIQNRCKFYNYKIAISPPPQEGNNAESLTEDMQQYEEILSVIHHMTLTMERSPKTFQEMKEENLRDFFLASINGQSKGQATGETFNGNGKTDILIRMAGKNIFIAECKFWGGEKKLKETLDQLLGYTTWRDTKLALLIFNRNKNFSAVLEQISEVMKNHPSFTQELSYPSETGFRFILHHPEDKNRELLLTVLAFEIPR